MIDDHLIRRPGAGHAFKEMISVDLQDAATRPSRCATELPMHSSVAV
jgi:hypothetical protein